MSLTDCMQKTRAPLNATQTLPLTVGVGVERPWHGPIARLTRECELHAMQTARDHHQAVTLRENRAACLVSLGDDSETRARASYE